MGPLFTWGATMVRFRPTAGGQDAKQRAHQRQIFVMLITGALLLRYGVVPGLLKIPAALDLHQTVAGEVHLSLLGILSRDIPINVDISAKAVAQPGAQLKIVESLRFNTTLTDSLLLREGLDALLRYTTLQSEYGQALRYFFGTESLTSTFWVDSGDGTYIAPEAAHGKRWMIPPSSPWPESYDSWQAGLERGTTFTRQPSERAGGLRLEHYTGDLGSYNIGTVQIPAFDGRVRLDSRGTIDLRFERQSHLLMGFNGELKLAAQIGEEQVNFLTLRLQMDEAEEKRLRARAGRYSLLIRLGRDGLPLAMVLSAFYLSISKKRRR